HVLPQGFHRIRYYGLLTSPTAPTTSRVSAPCSQFHSSRSRPSRLPTPSTKSRKRQSMPVLAAAAACASSRPSCRGNSQSIPPPASATDQDRHFMMAISELPPRKSRPSVAAFLSWPWLSSLQYCPHHATAVPIFPDTPTADQKTALPPRCNAIFHRSSHRA